jgi:serine/threonine-protein phosphatase 2A regulatory subunit B'
MKRPAQGTTKSSNQKPPQRGQTGQEGSHSKQGDARSEIADMIKFCTHVFDFKDENKEVKEKEERLIKLKILQDKLAIKSDAGMVIDRLPAVMEMIKANIFRPLPVVKKAGPAEDMGGFEEEAVADKSWPHLQPVYEFFLQLIVNDQADVKSLKNYVTLNFIDHFLYLFDSEEISEREYLKNILHRLYAKLVPRRKMIRKAVTDTFYTLIHEIYKFNGAAELLDIFASIISGFAVPLRDEHVTFFKTVIIPLHKVQTCQKFHNELLRCSMLFVSKDPILAFDLILGLLKYWPFASFGKETLFLAELLEVLDICDITKLDPHIEILFTRLIKCIASPHLQVSDRAMCFFENDFFLAILRQYKIKIFPIMVPIIYKLAELHWHKLLQDSLGALKNILRDIDPALFDKYVKPDEINKCKFLYLVQTPEETQNKRQTNENIWKELEKSAAIKNRTFVRPEIPYSEEHIVGEHNGLDNGQVLNID